MNSYLLDRSGTVVMDRIPEIRISPGFGSAMKKWVLNHRRVEQGVSSLFVKFLAY